MRPMDSCRTERRRAAVGEALESPTPTPVCRALVHCFWLNNALRLASQVEMAGAGLKTEEIMQVQYISCTQWCRTWTLGRRVIRDRHWDLRAVESSTEMWKNEGWGKNVPSRTAREESIPAIEDEKACSESFTPLLAEIYGRARASGIHRSDICFKAQIRFESQKSLLLFHTVYNRR
jgi:hypothetical protein